MARPTLLTPRRQRTLLDAITAGLTRAQAAAVVGISERTLYNWLRDDVQFLQTIKKADGNAMLSRLAIIDQAANEGTWQAAAWWLERRYPDEWGRRARIDQHVSGSVDGTDVREVVRSVGAVLHVVLGDDPVRRQWAADLLAALDAGEWNPDEQPEPPASIPRPEPPDPGPYPWTPRPSLPGATRRAPTTTGTAPTSDTASERAAFLARHTRSGGSGYH